MDGFLFFFFFFQAEDGIRDLTVTGVQTCALPILWDSLDPAWLDRAITWLRSQGRQPYLVFERREEPEFRARFRAQSDAGALDWPPRFDLGRQVRIYDPADRARYLAGESYPTENVPSPSRRPV